ncbi:hypothetical protein FA15DRAFT_583048 [Coprinopsis marcescibilis]|uniref:Uncharacterized protein n=1 Tax=Coprinopsis marcescibilis TaxID=230819 RepID=A0A5C3L8N4_COPMA|nr:hypothetical protein FA15DRAFT_583048 [Coprinopsis marcescibilis]
MSNIKGLSNGTLSLKFMQNALRAKQMKEVELQKAEVVDDGQWKVSEAVREAWGLTNSAKAAEVEVHEESYLPFIYSDEAEHTPEKPRGRRVFGKKGEEIATSDVKDEESSPGKSEASEIPSEKGRKIHPRPISISTAGSSGFLRGFDQLQKPNDSAKSARQMLFETGGVGTDLRRPSSGKETTPIEQKIPFVPQGFRKPSGVDEPVSSKNGSQPFGMDSSDKTHVKKPKRRRQVQSEGDDVPKKQKKAKQSNLT